MALKSKEKKRKRIWKKKNEPDPWVLKVILFFLEKSEDHLKKRKVKPKSSESFLKPGEGLDRSLEDSEDFGPHWKKEKAEKSCKEYNFRHINHIYYGLPHIFPSENQVPEALQPLKIGFRLHEDLRKTFRRRDEDRKLTFDVFINRLTSLFRIISHSNLLIIKINNIIKLINIFL